MPEEQGYQGWKNHATWAMNLWINNEEGTYNEAREMAEAAKKQAEADDREPAVVLADALSEVWEERMPDLGASVWSDLLTSAFRDIDWDEIADGFLED